MSIIVCQNLQRATPASVAINNSVSLTENEAACGSQQGFEQKVKLSRRCSLNSSSHPSGRLPATTAFISPREPSGAVTSITSTTSPQIYHTTQSQHANYESCTIKIFCVISFCCSDGYGVQQSRFL